MLNTIDDLRINSIKPLISPAILMEELPICTKSLDTIVKARQITNDIVSGKDSRLLVIVGPCSIHDTEAAIDYASLLKDSINRYSDLHIIMRVYFEKPRTTVGWKGLINDPNLDNSFNINTGLKLARKLLLDLAKMGVPTATEFLDTIIPQFISDLICWGAIGARTTESQIHRELASGLSVPVGFKNGTDGNVQITIDALRSAIHPHNFLSVTKHGIPAIIQTTGNNKCHVILRGSTSGPNYFTKDVKSIAEKLTQNNCNQKVMIDCSHGNSFKDHNKQKIVANDVCQQIIDGNKNILGVMLESNLIAGNQKLEKNKTLNYGQSITDACISWDETDKILQNLASTIQKSKEKNYA